jgi:rubrerythrin
MRFSNTWFTLTISLFFAMSLIAINGCGKSDKKPEQSKVLTDLNEAYNGESNAAAKYAAFAKKADEEGYKKVAVLFRAVANAEEIHIKNHAEVIKKLGGTPTADVKAPEIKTTLENLQAALKGETYEKDTMYHNFIKDAQAENNPDALKTFNFAMQAETDHAQLYDEAIKNLDSWKDGAFLFYVCPVCGHTVAQMTTEKCPICFTPKEKFLKVE